jgi:hypothetical protein
LKKCIQEDFKKLESSVQNLEVRIAKLEVELKNTEQRLVIKLGGLMAAFLAAGLTVAKLLFV